MTLSNLPPGVTDAMIEDAQADALCENCEKRPAVDADLLCQECIDDAAEAAYERQVENFYGGGEPATMDEIHRAAWEEKRSLR